MTINANTDTYHDRDDEPRRPLFGEFRLVPPKLPVPSRIKDYVQSRGGEVESMSRYMGAIKVAVRCQHGHRWVADDWTFSDQGPWCPECEGKSRSGLKVFQDLATRKGGVCESLQMPAPGEPLLMRCGARNLFKLTPTDALNGRWCECCGGSPQVAPVAPTRIRLPESEGPDWVDTDWF